MSFTELSKQLDTYCTPDDLQLVERSFEFAKAAHTDQKRKSGEPYIEHPLSVANYLAKMHLDPATIAAALLHDVVEDTSVTIEEIAKEFGSDIANLVDGVSKLGKVRIRKDFSATIHPDDKLEHTVFHSFSRQVEILRKMFIAMAKDIRVILIKLADRLHNLETLSAVDPDRQIRIARETLEIYAPIAHRLGIGEIKGRLEDLAFPYAYPKEYQRLQKMVGNKLAAKAQYLEKVKKVIQEELDKADVKGEINGRAKHLYSLFKKLEHYDYGLDQIYDLVALRIIVDNIEECYTVLGIIHKLWKPLPRRIKDYIAVPKPNGYQSLHTTVFCLDGQITEFQVRTRAMHEQAEYGVAAHWHYKSHPKEEKAPPHPNPNELSWVQQLADWQNKFHNTQELAEALKFDLFQDRIFVFTPKGDVHNLPSGASPIDFAFAIHTDIGLHCAGAKVNHKMVTLNHVLQNGDMVEIITSKKSSPKSDWLNFAKTSHARSMIKQTVKSKAGVL